MDNFWQGFEKESAVASEIAGTVLNPLSAALAIPAGVVGVIKGPRKQEDMKKVNKKWLSNLLVPGVAPYRLGRRLAGTE